MDDAAKTRDGLDDLVAYSYVGIPPILPLDFIDLGAILNTHVGFYRRPRMASFRFSPYMRTPVHDLPYDGVGVVAMHRDEWHELLRRYQDDLPPDIDLKALYGIAVEQW